MPSGSSLQERSWASGYGRVGFRERRSVGEMFQVRIGQSLGKGLEYGLDYGLLYELDYGLVEG